ncbi:MAG: DUF2505 family protein [Myxococcales bacterium]
MDFEITHTFDADREVVEQAMFELELAPFLLKNMTLVTHIELKEKKEDDKGIARKVHYVPVPMIKKVGTFDVEPEWMAWIEHSRFDRASHRLEFENVPVVKQIAELMEQKGTIRFEPAGPGKTKRVVSGVLKVKFPILGRVAEKIIYPNAEKILDEEARAFNAYLQQRKA